MLGYSERSRGNIVYNTETQIVEQSISVRFDDKLYPQKSKQNESLADIKVQFTGTEGNTSEAPNKDSPTTSEGNVISTSATSIEHLQKKGIPSGSILGKVEDIHTLHPQQQKDIYFPIQRCISTTFIHHDIFI